MKAVAASHLFRPIPMPTDEPQSLNLDPSQPQPLRGSGESNRGMDDGSAPMARNNTLSPVDESDSDLPPTGGFREFWRGLGACGFSMVIHIVLLVVLGVLVFDETIRAEIETLLTAAVETRQEHEEAVEIELSEEIETVAERTLAMISSSPIVGAAGSAAFMGAPQLDKRLVEQIDASEIEIEAPTIGIPDSVGLIQSVPDGDVKGEPRAIVGDYQEAMDRLAQEIVWMLDRGPVLVIWVFDQSNSMKDDQREIRDRIENVYDQLGILGTENSDALWTSVASYGQGFQVHTRQPTSNREFISAAIDSIPVDQTGQERMCEAVGHTIRSHRRFLRGRQMALVLVTDESGEPANNDRFLEAAIAEAKGAKCKVYVLGRESMFGYPYAFVRWRHPETQRMHWLEIDRGPETGFPEQLQTNGLRRRNDAFSSGFGPYEQSRMARETNGIFFMLPSVEEDLVGKQNRYRYDLEAMRPFLPDMRSRIEVLSDRDEHPLRSVIWQVINDLNPYNERSKEIVELDYDFPIRHDNFLRSVRENQLKAKLLLRYMADAERVLEQGKKWREQEPQPRWQANYDIIHAQLVSYQARIYEYGVGLEEFLNTYAKALQENPLRKDSRVLHNWHLRLRQRTLAPESRPYIDRANEMLEEVAQSFRGTPWGARAEWEMRRGYGVTLRPYYDLPWKEVQNPTPPPKL